MSEYSEKFNERLKNLDGSSKKKNSSGSIGDILPNKKPSIKIKVWKRILVNKGNGEATGTDWEKSKGVVSVNSKSANRKGK